MTTRERVWKVLLDRGPLAPSPIAELLGLSVDEVMRALRDLCDSRFAQRAAGGTNAAGEYRYEVTIGPRYDEQQCDRRLAEVVELRKEQRTPSAATPRPATSPAASHRPLSFIGTHGEQQRRVLEYLQQHGTATCDELVDALNIDIQSLTWRLKELREAGLIRRTGQKRKTRRGKPAHIWTLTTQPRLF